VRRRLAVGAGRAGPQGRIGRDPVGRDGSGRKNKKSSLTPSATRPRHRAAPPRAATCITFLLNNAPDAEIRISFRYQGSWSTVGTDALTVPNDQPTMNFGWLTPTTDDLEYQRAVAHEFGHALGLIHEHQNPAGGIQWNKPVVYRYYEGPPNNWGQQQVDLNLFQTYQANLTNFTETDPRSIMMYPIPAGFTTNGLEVGWNMQLSDMDKSFIAQMYPK
jgi:serralysin